jgi:hypothetical protein
MGFAHIHMYEAKMKELRENYNVEKPYSQGQFNRRKKEEDFVYF